MRPRPIFRMPAAGAVYALALLASPALAQDVPYHDVPHPAWKDNRPQPRQQHALMEPGARDAWLAECRRRLSRNDNGVDGAVIGGVAGNRIAGKGNRTVGTVAGAAIGAAAGMAIDKAEDGGAREMDQCEAYLENYYAYYRGYQGYGYGQAHPAYASATACCQQAPTMRQPRGEPVCTETVEYEYVDVPASPKPRHVPDKRIKVVPDKRIPVN